MSVPTATRSAIESPRLHGLSHGAMEGAQKIHGLLVRLLERLGLPAAPEVVHPATEDAEPMLAEAVRLQTTTMRMLEKAHAALDPEPPVVQQKRVQAARARRTTVVEPAPERSVVMVEAPSERPTVIESAPEASIDPVI